MPRPQSRAQLARMRFIRVRGRRDVLPPGAGQHRDRHRKRLLFLLNIIQRSVTTSLDNCEATIWRCERETRQVSSFALFSDYIGK